MTSLIYTAALEAEARGNIDFDGDTFKVMLVDASYAAIADETKKDSHETRADVTAAEIGGTNYTAGGQTASVSVARDDSNNKVTITLGGVTWAAATVSAAGAVYYKSRGGAASVDELIAFIDFGGTFTATNGSFTLSASTITKQN